MLTRALIARGHTVLAYEDDGVRIRRRDGTEASIGLSNLRRIIESVPEGEAGEQLAYHLRALEEAPSEAGEAGPQGPLVPRLMVAGGPKQPWRRALVPGALELGLAVDLPKSVRFVTPLDLVRWKIAVAEGEARAMAELRARSEGAEVEPTGVGAVMHVHLGDGLDASRLLLADELLPSPAGVLASVPGRDGLFLVSLDADLAPDGLLERATWELFSLGRHLVDRVPYPLTSRLFWVRAGSVAEVSVETDPVKGVRFVWPEGLEVAVGRSS